MNMEHLLAATKKVVELHNENVQLHTELADAKCKLAKYQNDSGDDSLYNVRRLRSELAEAIKQRDALAEQVEKQTYRTMTTLINNKFTGYSKTITTKGFPSVATIAKYLRASKAKDCRSFTYIYIDGKSYDLYHGSLLANGGYCD